MTRCDRLSFITTPCFLGTVGVVVGLLLAMGNKTSSVGYMAIFTGWICLCLAGTNSLLARILARLEAREPLPDETETGEKDG